jgi:hypothetical protein
MISATVSGQLDIETSAFSQEQEFKEKNMNPSEVFMTLILDKDMVVTDVPCSSATLIAQYPERYFAFAITAQGTCILGFEGEHHVSVSVHDLVDLFREKCAGNLQ